MADPRPSRSPGAVLDVGASLLLGVLALGPLLLHRGFALRGDMVFVPHQPWKGAWLGLDGSVPRSVPVDALVWLGECVLPGDLLQKAVLLAALVVAGVGIARLVARAGALGRLAAIAVFVWNPWVEERLAIGQWPAVVGYALMPWLVGAAVRWREGRAGGAPRTILLLVASAACAPSSGLLAALLVVVVLAPQRRRLLQGVGGAVVANLPWVVPSLAGPSIRATATQFGAFGARAESGLGVVASVVSLGGIWKASVVPPERGSAVVVLVAVALVLTSVAALVAFRGDLIDRATAHAVVLAGGIALLAALLPALGPIARLLGRASTHLPALGLLRDSQRFLAPFALVVAIGAAAAADALVRRARRTDAGDARALVLVAGLLVVLPLLLLPSMAWGLHDDLTPVRYPAEWDLVADQLRTGAASGESGAVVVLPWRGAYRGFAWNGERAVLDPAPRFLPGEVLDDDRTFLTSSVIADEDPYLRRIHSGLDQRDSARALQRLGVRWVLLEKGNGVGPAAIPPGSVVHNGPGLELVDLGTASASPRAQPQRWLVVLADAATCAIVIVSLYRSLRSLRYGAHTFRGGNGEGNL